MRILRNQAGVSHLLAVLLVVVVAVVGFAGYTVWKAGQDTSSTTEQTAVAPVDKIETKADLQNTGDYLDEAASSLNSDLDPSALDSSIDQLL